LTLKFCSGRKNDAWYESLAEDQIIQKNDVFKELKISRYSTGRRKLNCWWTKIYCKIIYNVIYNIK